MKAGREVEARAAAAHVVVAAALLNLATMKDRHPATNLDPMKGPDSRHFNPC